jgi:hypothetical protein
MGAEWAGDHVPRRARQAVHRGADAQSMVPGRRVHGPEKVDEEDQHSFAGWLADMLSWGCYTEIGEDVE